MYGHPMTARAQLRYGCVGDHFQVPAFQLSAMARAEDHVKGHTVELPAAGCGLKAERHGADDIR
jgi:hypothetical protein